MKGSDRGLSADYSGRFNGHSGAAGHRAPEDGDKMILAHMSRMAVP
jgi:hypothetical protein